MRLHSRGVHAQIHTTTPGVAVGEAWRGRQKLVIANRSVGFLGLVEFVKTKRACGRPKDLLDLELLREAGLLPRSRAASNKKSKR